MAGGPAHHHRWTVTLGLEVSATLDALQETDGTPVAHRELVDAQELIGDPQALAHHLEGDAGVTGG